MNYETVLYVQREAANSAVIATLRFWFPDYVKMRKNDVMTLVTFLNANQDAYYRVTNGVPNEILARLSSTLKLHYGSTHIESPTSVSINGNINHVTLDKWKNPEIRLYQDNIAPNFCFKVLNGEDRGFAYDLLREFYEKIENKTLVLSPEKIREEIGIFEDVCKRYETALTEWARDLDNVELSGEATRLYEAIQAERQKHPEISKYICFPPAPRETFTIRNAINTRNHAIVRNRMRRQCTIL
jgi:hypothetical protein